MEEEAKEAAVRTTESIPFCECEYYKELRCSSSKSGLLIFELRIISSRK